MATEFDVIFSGYQLRQVFVLNQHFKDHLGHHHHHHHHHHHQTLMMMTEMVFETLVQYGHLTQLIA
jgi:hypothetical protein